MTRARADVALRLARSPLLGMAVAGFVAYALYAWFGPAPTLPADARAIVVDRAALLEFLQYRSNAFDSERFGVLLDGMSDAERRALTADYVREQALYREALRLGLGEDDALVRQRLLERMRFLLEDSTLDAEPVDRAVLAAYLDRHAERYAVTASVTFAHVYFDTRQGGSEAARARAAATAAELADAGAGFNDAPRYGDPFPYLRNYVERTAAYVESQFGAQFAATLAGLEPDTAHWQGPFESTLGLHLVLLTARADARTPRLDEIRGRVEADYRRDRMAAALGTALEELAGGYSVELADDLGPLVGAEGNTGE